MISFLALRRIASSFAPILAVSILPILAAPLPVAGQSPEGRRGYYSEPALHGDIVVFISEGDLWSVSVHGGAARRLTTGSGTEGLPRISPDGQTVAFLASYEGPSEVYTIPIEGGLPQRRTWDGNSLPEGWSPDGRLLIATGRYSTLPGTELALIDSHGGREIAPLAQAAEGAYSTDGSTLFFTRWFKQPSETKRYKGGWAENIWRFDGKDEAVPLTADWAGTSTNPMYWKGRVYFLSDRDGVMNVYSMTAQGRDVKQESHQHFFDVSFASLDDGRVVYASGADLWLLDLEDRPRRSNPHHAGFGLRPDAPALGD